MLEGTPVCVNQDRLMDCPVTDLVFWDEDSETEELLDLENQGYTIKDSYDVQASGKRLKLAYSNYGSENSKSHRPLQSIIIGYGIPCAYTDKKKAYTPATVSPIHHPLELEVQRDECP